MSVSDDETVILVTHVTQNNEIKNDLFKSIEKQSNEFDLSLRDISMKKINEIE